VLRENVLVHTWIAGGTTEKPRGDDPNEVAIALFIFREKDEMVGALRAWITTLESRGARLTSQPMIGFTPCVVASWKKFRRGKQVAVVVTATAGMPRRAASAMSSLMSQAPSRSE